MPEVATAEPPTRTKGSAVWSNAGQRRETAEPWAEVRAAVAAGMSIRKACKRFGVSYDAARKRSQREAWMVPSTLLANAQAKAQAMGIDVPQMSLSPSKTPLESSGMTESGREKVGTVLAENLQELAESGGMIGAKLWHGQLVDAAKPTAKLAPLVDAKDILTAVKGLRLVAGLDKAGPVLALNLWGNGSNVPTRDTGTSTGTSARAALDCDEE